MKKFLPKEPHRVVFPLGFIALVYVVLYELWLTPQPIPTNPGVTFKLEFILSRIAYSIVATSIFFALTTYLTVTIQQKRKKMKVLYVVCMNLRPFEWLLDNLKNNLNIRHDFNFKDYDALEEQLQLINTNFLLIKKNQSQNDIST